MKIKNLSTVLALSSILFCFGLVFSLQSPRRVLSAVATHVVISEIQVAGDIATDEFVELYNPTSTPVDLTNWTLARKTAGGDETDIISASMSGTLAAHSYMLIAHENYDDVATEDITYTGPTTVSTNNTVLLYDENRILVDKVGMGTATDSETATVQVPIDNRSIERKALSTSTAADMAPTGAHETTGNGEDTDNNANDFVRHVAPTISNPQNSASSTEVPSAGPSPSPSDGPTPTPEPSVNPTPEPSPSVTPSPEPSTSPDVSPIPSPSVTPVVLISEVQILGDSATPTTDEFVELYNPGDTDVVMEDWSLTRKNSGHAEANLVASLDGTIPARGYFLIGHGTGYNGAVALDVVYSAPSNALTNNYSVLLYDASDTLVDKVGFGAPDDLGDGDVAGYETTPFPSNPPANSSVERKPGETDPLAGNGQDTNDNSNDFSLRTTAEPQNTNSSPEPTLASPSPSASPDVSPSPEPTVAPSPTPDATPSVSPSPDTTPSPTPVATPDVSPSPTPVVSASPEVTPTPTPDVSPTPTPDATPSPSPVATVSPSPVVSPSPSPTPDVSASPVATPDASPDASPTPEASPSVSPTPVASPDISPSVTPVASATPTPSVSPAPQGNVFFRGFLFTCSVRHVRVNAGFFSFFLPRFSCSAR